MRLSKQIIYQRNYLTIDLAYIYLVPVAHTHYTNLFEFSYQDNQV